MAARAISTTAVAQKGMVFSVHDEDKFIQLVAWVTRCCPRALSQGVEGL